MIKIDRGAIDLAKSSLFMAFGSATTPTGIKLKIETTDDAIEKAVMLALHSLAMDTFNLSEIVVASDIIHFSNFPKDERS